MPKPDLWHLMAINRSHNFMGKYQYTCQPSLLSVHLVILVESVACDMSAFKPPCPGTEAHRNMIVFFVNVDPNTKGFLGLDVARVHLFFSIDYQGITYPCALIWWMSCLGDKPDEDTGMWMVEPASNADGTPFMSVIHLDCILRAAHLIGICGDMFLHKDLSFNQSLDAFVAFYVNKFVDHHAFEIAY